MTLPCVKARNGHRQTDGTWQIEFLPDTHSVRVDRGQEPLTVRIIIATWPHSYDSRSFDQAEPFKDDATACFAGLHLNTVRARIGPRLGSPGFDIMIYWTANCANSG